MIHCLLLALVLGPPRVVGPVVGHPAALVDPLAVLGAAGLQVVPSGVDLVAGLLLGPPGPVVGQVGFRCICFLQGGQIQLFRMVQ